jgi:broad specificity phosphatase PhoE
VGQDGGVSFLVVVRHAQPAIDPARPAAEWDLTEEGEEAAFGLAHRLQFVAPRVVVSSTETKCRTTALCLADALGISFHTADGLHEHERPSGSWVPDPVEWEGRVRRLFSFPDELVLGQETARQTVDRFSDAVDLLLRRAYREGTVCVITGGTALSLYVQRRAGLDPFDTWQSLAMPAYAVFARPGLDLVELVPET